MDNPRNSPGATPGYETRDANATGVFNFLVILGIVLVVTALVCWGIFRFFTVHEVEAPATESPFADTRQIPLGPVLQVSPRQDWLKFKEEQEKSLEILDWANRSAGTARVPIELAMQLLVKKGVPVQSEQPQGGAAPPKFAGETSKKQ
jgi:hypothetical protein